MIREVGNIELCELLDVEPKAQSKACLAYWDVSTAHCTSGHPSRDGTEEENKNSSSTLSISSRFPITTSRKGDPTGTVTGRSRGITSTSPRIRSRRNATRDISWVFTTGSSRDEKFCKNMIDIGRNEEVCRQMDDFADEDHTHRITEEGIRVYRNNWWIRSNIVSSDTMPVRHRADFKQDLTTLRQLKNQEDTAYYPKWQNSSSSWWDWQDSWWYSSSEHHRDDEPSPDRSGKPDGR